MGIREWSNNHPKATGTIVGGCILVCVGGIVAEAMGNRHTITTNMPDDYFSIDDGKTFFAANSKNVPPFQYEGTEADRANVFDCNGVKFVAFLDRYTPEAKKVIEAGQGTPPWVEVKGREVKRPGEKGWTSAADQKALVQIITVVPPNGLNGPVEPAEP